MLHNLLSPILLDNNMKLNEISVTNSSINREFKNSRLRRVSRNYNQGSFSSVYDKKNDPHSIIKTNKSFSDENNDTGLRNNTDFKSPINIKKYDGYHHYVDILMETKIYEENPYFLRVRNIHTVTDKNNKNIYNFDVEKLFPLYKFGVQLIKNYFYRIFELDDSYDQYFNNIKDVENIDAIQSLIYYILMRDRHKIKDNLLKEALNFLRVNSGQFSLDLHGENILYRNGKQGMQMVFSDPYGVARGSL